MDINLSKQLLYVAALGNNSLETVDIQNGRTVHSVQNLDEPQGVAYITSTNEVFVANGGNGICCFYNAADFEKTANISLGSDADDVRYDARDKKIYVGYGQGGLAIIDVLTHQIIAKIALPAHPEGFQIDKQLNKVFVNVPGATQIDVIDLQTRSIAAKWRTAYRANFPMAVDTSRHILFIGFRNPAKLVAINAVTGAKIAEADLVTDVDDLFFDGEAGKVYASGGGGYINIFSYSNSTLRKTANIGVRNGARTSLLIPSMQLFIIAERARAGQAAALSIFETSR
jgi:DNA-binding beta-propeller fold protein YncE